MKAGTYIITDLCYVLSNEDWEYICEHQLFDGEFKLPDGRAFAQYSTQYGDGEYSTTLGGEVSVDSGTIGCVRLEDMSKHVYDNMLEDLGVIHTFDTDFVTGAWFETESHKYDEEDYDYYESNSKVLAFGKVKVFT